MTHRRQEFSFRPICRIGFFCKPARILRFGSQLPGSCGNDFLQSNVLSGIPKPGLEGCKGEKAEYRKSNYDCRNKPPVLLKRNPRDLDFSN